MKRLVKKFATGYFTFWARFVLRERRPRIIGVTGSVGKTTTKEAIFAALSTPDAQKIIGSVGRSAGNLNTELGLPLAILLFDTSPNGWLSWFMLVITAPVRALILSSFAAYPGTLILEYAADRPGDIGRLIKVARPDIAVVTAAGPAHLEKFITVERVVEEKGKLARAVSPAGLVVLARDNSHVSAMARGLHAPVKKVAGRGMTLSRGIAQAIADHFGILPTSTTKALQKFASLTGRLAMRKRGGALLIDDTYNANPLSMELALDTLAEQAPKGVRKVAILGHMAELGDKTEYYHLEIGKYARSRVDVLIAVGQHSMLYDGDYWYPTSAVAADRVGEHLRPTDAVLVKGSRSAAMEKVVRALEASAKEKNGSD